MCVCVCVCERQRQRERESVWVPDTKSIGRPAAHFRVSFVEKWGAIHGAYLNSVKSSCEELGNIRKYLYSASFFFFFIFVFPSKENSCNRSNYECGFVGLDPLLPSSRTHTLETPDSRTWHSKSEARNESSVLFIILILLLRLPHSFPFI